MHIDWWTLALQAVNGLVLIWLLSRFLFRPVANILAERQARTERMLSDAKMARQQAEQDHATAAEKLAELAAGRAQAYAAIEADAAAARATLLAQVQQEAAARRAEDDARRAAERRADVAQSSARSVALAFDLAEKLMRRLPDAARVADFADGVATALAQLPDDARALLGTPDVPLTVTSAVKLSDAQVAAFGAAFERALAHPAQIVWRVDPTLLAGFECEAPHTIVRNNLRYDLEQMRLALIRDETS
jgi:F-type H+-transporting ATPase subunit b